MKVTQAPFHVQTLNSRKVAGLVLREEQYAPGMKYPEHQHEYAFFCLLLTGSYDETIGTLSRTCRPATLTFQSEGDSHAVHYHGEGGRLFSIEIEPQWMRRLQDYSLRLGHTSDFHEGLPSPLAMRIYREFRNSDTASALAIEGLGLELMAEVSRHRRRIAEFHPSDRVEQTTDYLQAHFADSLNLTALAALVGVHPTHLTRAFRKRHGCTIGEYVRRLRIEAACNQFFATDASLATIALEAGFADQAHFSRVFKRLTGLTPAEYRSSLRANPRQKSDLFKTSL